MGEDAQQGRNQSWLQIAIFYLLASFLGTGTILLVVQGVIPSSLVLFSVLSVSIAGISMTAVADGMDGLKFLFGRLLIWRVGFVILAGIDQELGWTGFMVPRLQEQVNALASAFIRAILVAIWHIPVFVYSAFRPETMAVLPYGDWIRQEGFLVVFLVAVLLFMIPWSIFFIWIFNNTKGSLLLVAILHGSEIWVIYWMISTGIKPDNLDNYWGYGVLMVLVAIIVVIANGPANLSRKHERITYDPADFTKK